MSFCLFYLSSFPFSLSSLLCLPVCFSSFLWSIPPPN
jgi:hypothetical protein